MNIRPPTNDGFPSSIFDRLDQKYYPPGSANVVPAGQNVVLAPKKSFRLEILSSRLRNRRSSWSERLFGSQKVVAAGQNDFLDLRKSFWLAGTAFWLPKSRSGWLERLFGSLSGVAVGSDDEKWLFSTSFEVLPPDFESQIAPRPQAGLIWGGGGR